MSMNSLRKTRWKTEPRSISVFPYGVFYILSFFFALAFGVFFFLNNAPQAAMISLGVIVAFIALFGSTKVVFDNEKQSMQKKLFGFIPTVSLPFEKMEAINIVRNNVGGYNFRAFRKNDKFGKGTIVSAGYSKDTDKNALAFVDEVIGTVHAWLDNAQVAEPTHHAPISSYNFFEVNQTEHVVKKSKIYMLTGAIAFLAFAGYAITHDAVMADSKPFFRYAVIFGSFVLGVLLVAGSFTKIIFDTAGKVVRVNAVFRNKEYAFEDFDGFQIVRRSTNMIYTGTDVQIYFRENNNRKAGMLVLKTFMGTKKIDRFLDETKNIMM